MGARAGWAAAVGARAGWAAAVGALGGVASGDGRDTCVAVPEESPMPESRRVELVGAPVIDEVINSI